MHLRRTCARLAAAVATAAALLALSTTVAFAGPGSPTLNVDQLQATIDANGGSLHGYLKTVIKGSDIVTLTVDVLGVTTGFGSGPADMSSLILFESNDTTITKIGGIASGMSGSPIYVDDGTGTDKLVGALSYGDAFTTGGTGLATPIEAMVNMQSESAAAGMMRTLAGPVVIDGQVKDRVMVVQDTDSIASVPAGTIVAKPLSAVYVGGLNPKSRMYKAYTKVLESKGIEVITPLVGGLSSKVSTYNAAFEGGSAVAVLAARGDLWSGGIGTVTYTDADKVVAFGHPAYWEGPTGLYLCNAWIDGIWPSTLSAYKLGRPAAVRGTLTQDRAAGVLGIDGQMPRDVPVTAKATFTVGSKTRTATSSVEIPTFVADSSSENYIGLAAASAYVAGSRVFDSVTNPGSAITKTTVVVKDASDGTTYTLVRRNHYSDGTDISAVVVSDVSDMVTNFEEANGNGIAHANVLSVDLETTFSAIRKEAAIVDLTVAGGLKAGANTVTVSLLTYGEVVTQTVDVPITIPANVPLTGNLSATAVNNPGSIDGSSDSALLEMLLGGGIGDPSIDRRTVKDVVRQLSTTVDNTVVSVAFQPATMTPGDSGDPTSLSTEEFAAIESTRATDWVVSGTARKIAPRFDVSTEKSGPVAYGEGAFVTGQLTGVVGKGIVTVFDGSTTKTVSATDGAFSFDVNPLFKKKTLVISFLGNESALPARATLTVNVFAKTSLRASKNRRHGTPVTLTARVSPKSAGGHVAFQRLSGKTWKTIRTVNLRSSGTATYKYRPKRGTVKVRARFKGSSTNAASNSKSLTLKIR